MGANSLYEAQVIMKTTNLDVDMSCLEINEQNASSSNAIKRVLDISNTSSFCSPEMDQKNENIGRSLRKRFRSQSDTVKRQIVTKPKKFTGGTMKETVNYYLDKRVKRLPPSLETIFEEPDSEIYMSKRKFKRCLEFSSPLEVSKDKLKLKRRSMKAKKVSTIRKLKKKVTMDFLMETLASIETDSCNTSNVN